MMYEQNEKGIEPLQSENFSREKSETELHRLIEIYPPLVLPEFLNKKKEQFEVFHELNLGSAGSADFVIAWEDGTILLIEAKLSTNGEIKRQVVGQLFDYASKLKMLSPAKLVECMKDNKSTHKEFLNDEAFLKKLGNPLYLAIVSDRIVGGLKRIMGWLGNSKCPHQIYGVEINRYTPQQGHFLEQRFFLPEELGFGIRGHKLTDQELMVMIQDEFGNDAEEIDNFLKSVPHGWKKENKSATITVSFHRPRDPKLSLSIYFNPEELAIFGRSNEYEKVKDVIKSYFPDGTIFPKKQTKSDLFV